MRNILQESGKIAVGVAVGTLIYSRFLDPIGEFDFSRAVFVGLFVGVIFAVWPRKK